MMSRWPTARRRIAGPGAAAEIAAASTGLHSWCTVRPHPVGGTYDKGSDVSDNYPKDPEAVSRLTPEQYRVTQQNGTEPAGRLWIVLPALLAWFCGSAGVGSGAWVPAWPANRLTPLRLSWESICRPGPGLWHPPAVPS
jgi:hypothetical protein